MILNKEWFTDQVYDHQDELYRLAYHILRNKEDAEDALQEALILAYSNLGQLKQPKYFKTWITRILLNTCFDIQRKQKINVNIEDVEETVGESKDMTIKVLVEEAIGQLNEQNQKIVMLFYYGDYSVREISEVLNLSVVNVKQKLSRSRKTLKKILEGGEKGA